VRVSNPPLTPTEWFASIMLWLTRAVDGPSMFGPFSRPLALLIMGRIRTINQAFARIAERIRAGTCIPSRPAETPRQRTGPHPRGKSPLPQGFAWLVKLLPETAVYGSQLQFLFADPAMAALMAAAPNSLGRPVRSLCHMLGIAPPAILAPPARPRPPRAIPTAAPEAPAPRPAPPPQLQLPAWMRPPPARKRNKLARIYGLPHPA
jgi:hypothetical protein